MMEGKTFLKIDFHAWSLKILCSLSGGGVQTGFFQHPIDCNDREKTWENTDTKLFQRCI